MTDKPGAGGNRAARQAADPGIYQIYWKEGGSSIAAVGVTASGGRWIAPINWIAPSEDQDIWERVESVTLVPPAPSP